MPRILLSASFSEDLFLRQTPAGGSWDDFTFLTQPSREPVDGWVVYDDLRQPLTQTCNPANTLLITGEPESVRRYRSRFTGQFGQVWTSHRSIRHPRVTVRNEAQTWHYAMRAGAVHQTPLQFDQLCELPRPNKQKMISVICSSKAITHDQRQRLEFVKLLKSHFGDSIDVFGRGIQTIADKSEAIYNYKYHIVLENDHSDYFMTEKLADAFLGWSYPIYFGGSEAYHRYPEGSFTAIDIYKPEESIAILRNVMAAETYENSLDNIAQAREAVLFKNNLMAMLAEYWKVNLDTAQAESITLQPKCNRTALVLGQVRRAVCKPFSRQVA